MRATFVASLLLVSVIQGGTATAGECPPDALGVARTIVVDPREHPRIGAFQYLETLPLNDKEVVLTFDDSVASHHAVVRPILKRYGFGATFFITEGFSFPTNKQDYMTWAQIAELHRDGFEIGNHTRNHLAVSV